MRFTVWKETYEYRTKGLYIGPPLAKLKSDYPLADFENDMEIDGWVQGGLESQEDVLRRAHKVIERLKNQFCLTDKVALVSHGGFNNVLLMVLLRCVEPNGIRFSQANCCINALRISTDGVHIGAINKTDHLFLQSPQDEEQVSGVSA
jgi:broad specificity phosphatase PhoE